MNRSPITTHILDTARGCPAAAVRVVLEKITDNAAGPLGEGVTDSDGRVNDLLKPGVPLEAGDYRLTFHVAEYLQSHGSRGFFPLVQITFRVEAGQEHYHVPLLLSPFGYSTYRGS